jgi:hypothetical protein
MTPEAIKLLDMLGATNAVDPALLKGRAVQRIGRLIKMYLFQTSEAERREQANRQSALLRSDASATAFALRVLLRPEVQEVVQFEMDRDERHDGNGKADA